MRRAPPPAPPAAALTPPRYAARLGVEPEKVLAWIRAGELRAVNVATKRTGRPRYIIAEADIAVFEARREAKPPAPTPARRRKPDPQVIEFF